MAPGSSHETPASAHRNTAGMEPAIHVVTLKIKPNSFEQEFWESSGIRRGLCSIDQFAFVVSSLNIISGWHTAAQLKSWPTASAVYQTLCYLFAILSVIQQLHLRWGSESYYEHRTCWLLITRCVVAPA
jgi:hypothetical protein